MDTTLLTKLNEWAGTKGIDFLCEESGLSACFKWLVPKLLEQDIDISLFMDKGKPAGIFLTPLEVDKRIVVDAETPALALCLAIERLIDAERD